MDINARLQRSGSSGLECAVCRHLLVLLDIVKMKTIVKMEDRTKIWKL